MSEIVEALNRIQAARSGEGSRGEAPQAVAEIPDESVVEVAQRRPADLRDFFAPSVSMPKPTAPSALAESSEPAEPELDEMLVEDWLRILKQEYVRSYIRDGGSSVKFAIGSCQETRPALQSGLSALGKEEGLLFARVDARFTKMHMVDRLFFKVAKQIDWDELAYNFLVDLVREKGYQVPDKWEDFSLTKLAQLNDRKEALLWKDMQTWIERTIEADLNLCQEFRMAMISLCTAQLQSSDADLHVAQSVKEWLRGELRLISSVKHALIFQKISRHNGRHMLTSLTHWLRRAKKTGLLLTLDLSRYLVAKKPAEIDSTFYYSSAAVLDLYDTLRQFIDSVDDHAGCLIVVLAPKEFLSDRRRGLDRYEALKLRIWDDVRDKYQQNPLAPMVRLSASPANVRHHSIGIGATPLHQGAASLRDRRVIEGLRAGVPNLDVIRVMGCYQPEVEGRFERMLTAVDQQAAEGQSTRGMIVEGGFGTGKSHVLAYLQHLALEQQCICSRVIISKETPLYHPLKVFQAAVESAVMPGQTGQVLVELANRLDVWSPGYQELSDWVHDYRNGMDQRFAATMFLFQRMSTEPEMCHRVTRFWSGEPLAMNEIRACLRQCGVFQNYSFARIREVDLAIQRFRFAARLMRLAGYRGWVVCLDEAELIGRYSFVQRLKAYAELSRMLGASPEVGIPGLAAVVALTDDFQSEILESKGDRARVLAALGKVGTTAQLEKQAEQGVRFIEWDTTPLRELTEVRVEEAYHKIRQLHHSVYGDDRHASMQIQESTPAHFKGKRMREWVKSWVTEWDLKRLLACEDVDIQIRSVKQAYEEDQTLNNSVEEETEPSAPGDVERSNTPEVSVQPVPIEKKPNPFAVHLSASSESTT
ncbi:BREX system ATP-binding domain-containing protein [Candidatus Nitronereus thalassa]|uniref:DUF2791 family P-loop domain-containing protein n=1 Tax=Candidatus Nitronereus thalassa TaxID=3020898 RepID=A0ABU3K6N7_9BACT|nr:BREX system ATP-binding domain-containing protein [Candidatus Nitronereus thalassa]MDT7042100.1 DUF2791 family P-loop domain-containing protein [Candidatus Nitronereus thalassa]